MQKIQQSILCHCILISSFLPAAAQDREISGIAFDQQSNEPIAFVTIISSKSGAVTKSKGEFNLHVGKTDSLIFSHVNYEKKIIYTASLLDSGNRIYLKPIIINLREIIITDIPTEEDFIEQVLEYQPQINLQEHYAKFNFLNTQNIYLSDWRSSMDSKDNFTEYLKGPQPFTFFSTNPRKGILSLFRKKPPPPRVKFNQQKINPLDTLKPWEYIK